MLAVCLIGVVTAEEYHKLESLVLQSTRDSGCSMVMSSVLVLTCDSQYLIFNSEHYLENGGRGVYDHGRTTEKLGPVEKIVESETEVPNMMIVNETIKEFTTLFAISSL